MKTISVDAVLEGLSRAPSNAVVAFDCDGTLWSGDVGEDWFVALIEREGLAKSASDAMRAEAMAHGIPVDSLTDRAVAEAMLAAANEHRYDEKRLYEMMAWAGAGRSEAEVAKIIDAMLGRVGLPSRLYEETLAILRAARADGRAVVAVSASPRAVIEACLAHLGVEASAVCAATQAIDRGVLLPSLSAPMPYAHGKVLGLRAIIGDAPVAVALGDSAFDLEMLALATQPLAVRPKPALRERGASLATLRELERLTR
ncbi:MAG: haloacid dehalogenase-like hydrolase [Myxococcales bacterium]|nr:haloacid dehalogenase-like hydrolase [Myxococcales bacterium]